MPNPEKYKDKSNFMKDCIHQTLHVEKKRRDQSIGQCLNMWRQKKHKTCVSEFLKDTARILVDKKAED
jgi:hypothetical protein